MKIPVKTRLYIMTLMAIGLFVSCEELIIEQDISDRTVEITAPFDGAHINSTGVSFSWEAVEDALQYRLVVAKPDFGNTVQIVLDTVITSTSFVQQLPVGSYQWKVRAENGSSHTNYALRSLQVASNDDFQDNLVVLSSPQNNLNTNHTSVTLSWNAIIDATAYQLQIYDTNNSLINTQTLTQTTYSYVFPEGTFIWKVRAQNGSVQTAYAQRTITVDTTPPATPTLLAPQNQSQTDDGNIAFQWNRTAIGGSPEKDSLYIYHDNAMSVFVSKHLATSPFDLNLDAGTYFWKVKAFDDAGNIGNSSSLFSFTVN